MNHADIAGLALLICISPIIINDFLDFMVPGRWERRAYKRSMEEFNREIRRRDKRNGN